MWLVNQAEPPTAEADEDEEEVEPELCYKSQQECRGCEEPLTYTDEIFLLEVSEAAIDDGALVWQPLYADDGDYQYTPLLMHFDCWEEVLEQIRSLTEDAPPVDVEGAVCKCSVCESGIGGFEPFVATTFGEIQVSGRQPNGELSEKIHRIGKMTPVCLACVTHVVEDYLDDWEDLIELPDDWMNED